MNATVQSMLKQYEMQVKTDTLREVAEKLSNKARMYQNLIDNQTAFEIYMQTRGKTFDSLSRKRVYLRSKCEVIWMLSGEIWKEVRILNKMRMK